MQRIAYGQGEDEGARPRRRGPSNRRRFVARAETLKGDKVYARRIERLRRGWNDAHPVYRIDATTSCPQPGDFDDRVALIGDLHYPKQLEVDFEAYRGCMRNLDGARFIAFDEQRRIGAAVEAWRALLVDMTSEFWPAPDFPHALHVHPATLFVALTLLHRIDTVPAQSIFTFAHEPEWAPAHPGSLEAYPEYARLAATLETLERRLIRAIEGGDPINADEAAAMLHEAKEDGDDAYWSRPLVPNADEGFWFVPIGPEMTTGDWEDARRSALSLSQERYGADIVGDRVRFWRAQDKSNLWIAAHLGITKETVKNHQ